MATYQVVKYGHRLYKGFVENDLPNGEGQLIWKSGSRYIGTFNHGKQEGFGVMSWRSFKNKKASRTYQGNWKKGKEHGYGKEITFDGKGGILRTKEGMFYKGNIYGPRSRCYTLI